MSEYDWKKELLTAAPIDLGPSKVLALQVHCSEQLDELEKLRAENAELKKAAEVNWHKWNYTELEESNAKLTRQHDVLKEALINATNRHHYNCDNECVDICPLNIRKKAIAECEGME